MRIIRKTAIIGTFALCLCGCTTYGHSPVDSQPIGLRQSIGAAVGTIGGALIGSQIGASSGKTIATMAGGMLGGMFGSAMGERMEIDSEIARGSIETTDQYDTPAPYTYSLGPNPEESYYYRSAYW